MIVNGCCVDENPQADDMSIESCKNPTIKPTKINPATNIEDPATSIDECIETSLVKTDRNPFFPCRARRADHCGRNGAGRDREIDALAGDIFFVSSGAVFFHCPYFNPGADRSSPMP